MHGVTISQREGNSELDRGKRPRDQTSTSRTPRHLTSRHALFLVQWNKLLKDFVMSRHRRSFTASILIGSAAAAAMLSGSLMAADRAPPDFTPNPSAGWFAYSREWIAPRRGPGPVMQHPDHPLVSNDDYRVTGKQPTLPIADPDNPILQPWARDVLLKRNERRAVRKARRLAARELPSDRHPALPAHTDDAADVFRAGPRQDRS